MPVADPHHSVCLRRTTWATCLGGWVSCHPLPGDRVLLSHRWAPSCPGGAGWVGYPPRYLAPHPVSDLSPPHAVSWPSAAGRRGRGVVCWELKENIVVSSFCHVCSQRLRLPAGSHSEGGNPRSPGAVGERRAQSLMGVGHPSGPVLEAHLPAEAAPSPAAPHPHGPGPLPGPAGHCGWPLLP